MMFGNPSTVQLDVATTNFGPNRNATPMRGNNDIKRGQRCLVVGTVGERWRSISHQIVSAERSKLAVHR
jgi:hypothetical protein